MASRKRQENVNNSYGLIECMESLSSEEAQHDELKYDSETVEGHVDVSGNRILRSQAESDVEMAYVVQPLSARPDLAYGENSCFYP